MNDAGWRERTDDYKLGVRDAENGTKHHQLYEGSSAYQLAWDRTSRAKHSHPNGVDGFSGDEPADERPRRSLARPRTYGTAAAKR